VVSRDGGQADHSGVVARAVRGATRRARGRVLSPRCIFLGDERYFDVPSMRVRRVVFGLLVIGAQKAGTTSLHAHLASHPDVFMSRPVKEPGYFLDDARMRRWSERRGVEVRSRSELLGTWMLQGYRGEHVLGESTTGYSDAPLGRRFDVPERVRRHNPSAKIVYVVRDPVARIVSNALHAVRAGRLEGSLDTWLDARMEQFVVRSLYWTQLRNWLDEFPAEQTRVVLLEELSSTSEKVLGELAAFLGIPPLMSPAPLPVLNRTDVRAGDDEIRRAVLAHITPSVRDRLDADVAALETHLGLSAGALWSARYG
jgi:hypothetical protein